MASVRTELISAYAVSLSRVGAWAVVSGMVMRTAGAAEFGGLSATRSLATVVGYLGVAMLPVVMARLVNLQAESTGPTVAEGQIERAVLDYEPREKVSHFAEGATRVFGAGVMWVVGVGVAVVGAIVAVLTLQGGSGEELAVAAMMGGGMLARAMGDVGGAVLQARGQLTRDNMIAAGGEWLWPGLLMATVISSAWVPPGVGVAEVAALTFLLAGLCTMLLRMGLGSEMLKGARRGMGERPELGRQVSGGGSGGGSGGVSAGVVWGVGASAGMLVLGQLADYCYAPLNQVLIAMSLGTDAVAAYAPAVQVDGAMLLLTGAVAAVVLPRATRALAAGEVGKVWRYYVVGTGVSVAVLVVVAVPVGWFAGPLLTVWLGGGVPTLAAAVVPLVLIHTVIGGASGVGRAVILAAGRYRTYAGVALGFGVVNLAGVAAVLWGTGWGVKGVVGVTVATVAVRCGIWMPWYVSRILGAYRAEGAGAVNRPRD